MPDHEQGLASGLVKTSFQVGGAIGLAIVSAIVSSVGPPRPMDGFRPAIAVSAGLAVLGLLASRSG